MLKSHHPKRKATITSFFILFYYQASKFSRSYFLKLSIKLQLFKFCEVFMLYCSLNFQYSLKGTLFISCLIRSPYLFLFCHVTRQMDLSTFHLSFCNWILRVVFSCYSLIDNWAKIVTVTNPFWTSQGTFSFRFLEVPLMKISPSGFFMLRSVCFEVNICRCKIFSLKHYFFW